MAEAIFFWLFGGLAAILGLLVILFKNPVHSAVALIANLFCIAALFALLDAHFLAAIQVLVYAGAILVLFLFVIMLLNLKPAELGQARQTATKIGGALVLLWVAFKLVIEFVGTTGKGFPEVGKDYGTLETVGGLLFGQYLLPFEVASVLLLAAILGAVAIAKKRIW
jgi:NADH-quinone oxidoreductase subunit J